MTIRRPTREAEPIAPSEAPGTAEAGVAAPAAGRGSRFGFGLTANTLLAYTLVKGLQLALYNLIFPLYAYSLGFDQAAIGQLNALGAITVFVVSVPFGVLADRVGRGRLLALSALVVPPLLAGIALSRSFAALAVFIVAQNAAATIYWSTTTPLLVGAVAPERRARAFSINSFFILGVGALGAVLGGAIAAGAARLLGVSPEATGPLRAALLVNAGLMLLGGLPLWRIRRVEGASAGAGGRARPGRADLVLFARLLVPDALQALGAGAIIGFLPLFFALRFGVPTGQLGLIFTLTGALGGVASLASPALVARAGNARAIAGLMVAIAGAMAATAAAPTALIAIGGEGARAALRGMIDPIYAPYAMTRVAPHQRGTLGGLYNVTYATGFSLGPLFSGALQVRYGFGPAFAAGAAAYVLAALAVWTLFRGAGE